MKNLLTSCPFPSCHPSLHFHKTQVGFLGKQAHCTLEELLCLGWLVGQIWGRFGRDIRRMAWHDIWGTKLDTRGQLTAAAEVVLWITPPPEFDNEAEGNWLITEC